MGTGHLNARLVNLSFILEWRLERVQSPGVTTPELLQGC